MRAIPAVLTLVAFLIVPLGLAPAYAEKRMFIIANNSDGYGIDRCLSSGASCGHAIATAYCRAREYDKALSFRKVDRDDITGAIPTTAGSCHGSTCEDFVAIECAR